MDYTLEQYPVLNYLGLSSDHVTKYLMRYLVNVLIYNSMISRNSNFRPSDWTSIWNSEDPRKYIQTNLLEEHNFKDEYILMGRSYQNKNNYKAIKG